MRVYILYSLKDAPYGGANQFLTALSDSFREKGLLTDTLAEADIVLFNSSNDFERILFARHNYPKKIFVHRVDGPCRFYNNKSDKRDDIVYSLNNLVADATIFQSAYSRNESVKMGCPRQLNEIVIHNGCNSRIFYRKKDARSLGDSRKLKIIASSFSDNWNKGFKTYEWLDKNLDFSRYEMTFVGNSPCEFENIRLIPPKSSKELAELLRQHDIYITASVNDPCSNALIEALSCGLFAIARNSGGHPEILGGRGFLFDKDEDILNYLSGIDDIILKNREVAYELDIGVVAQRYYDFFKTLIVEKNDGRIMDKNLNYIRVIAYIASKKVKKWF